MEYKDYYKILGVGRDATTAEIRAAYRRLARKYHPDVSRAPDAEARFKEVNEAHEVLRDEEKRRTYDRLGSGWMSGQEFRPPPGWEDVFAGAGRRPGFGAGGASFSEFFESLFGGMGAAGPRRRSAGFASAGEDERARILVSLEDAFHGAVRTIQVQVPEVGPGGQVVSHTRSLKVRIPPGVTQGRQIRLAGQGGPGRGGGPRGDLYLEVELQRHPLFRAEGRNIYLDFPVAPWEAALGATLKVPTLAGDVDVKIHPGSQSGLRMRLKGRGLPGSPPGDHFLVLRIVTPPADDARARALYERMARELSFDPRSRLGRGGGR